MHAVVVKVSITDGPQRRSTCGRKSSLAYRKRPASSRSPGRSSPSNRGAVRSCGRPGIAQKVPLCLRVYAKGGLG
jgi:hypothetical protein